MNRFERTAARQYLRRAAFFASSGDLHKAIITIRQAWCDSDVSEDMYYILEAFNDGIDDYLDIKE